ncbi:MAG: ATP-binding protein [bacterium]|nr:ATP-binding protein [bacterium]
MNLDQFKEALIRLRPTVEICQIVVEFLADALGAAHQGIYLWSENEGAFTVWPEQTDVTRQFMIYDPFLLHMTDDDRVYYSNSPGELGPIQGDAERFFHQTGAELVIPLVLNQSLVGVIFAGRTSADLSSPEVMRLIGEVRSLAVMALSNSILYSRLEGILEHLEEKVQERTRELENAQSQLVQSEKMAMLGVMVAGIAHEINTPASVINGSVDNIERNLGHILNNLKQLRKTLPAEKQPTFFRLMNLIGAQLTSGQARPARDAFKRKRELTARLEQDGWQAARDVATFLVENGFYAPQKNGNAGDAADAAKDEERLDRFMRASVMKLLHNLNKDQSPEAVRFVIKFAQEVGNTARNLGNIRNGIRNIVRIVRALKSYSHLDQGGWSQADVVEGIENTLIIMSSVMKTEVTIERSFGEIPQIVCNPDELNQVWTNLLTNAYQAMKDQSDARIRIRTALVEGGAVLVEIQDNGPGIPPAVLSKIWDPFFTTKDQGEGSGLGLGIVQGIIEKHKGKIEVISYTADDVANQQAQAEVARGTVFRVTLPIEGPGENAEGLTASAGGRFQA